MLFDNTGYGRFVDGCGPFATIALRSGIDEFTLALFHLAADRFDLVAAADQRVLLDAFGHQDLVGSAF